MTSFLQISTNFPALNLRKQCFWGFRLPEPLSPCTLPSRKIQWVCRNRLKNRVSEEKFAFLGVRKNTVGNFVGDGGWKGSKRVVLVRFTGFNGGLGGGGGGGGGKDDGTTARVLGNLTLAIGLTYLTMTGQLGWVLDAIVSVWLLAVLLPIVGLGAFLWWAGRDIVQGTCPNCGNGFQVFKSTLNDDLQLCPFCSQPFSVVGDEFVRDPVKFSNQSTSFEEAFSDRFPGSKKGKNSSVAVVDVEAEVKDAD